MTLASRLLAGDSAILNEVCRGLIHVANDNLIARPWGGHQLPAFKGVSPKGDGPVGETFELSAYPADAEAAANPSKVRLADGSIIDLPSLIESAAEAILGSRVKSRHGAALPLLPKFLNVKSLLSVQAHPAGNPECYIVLEAEAGASLRLGFARNVDAQDLGSRCQRGRAAQEALLELAGSRLDAGNLQVLVAPLLAQREADTAALDALYDRLAQDTMERERVRHLYRDIHQTYWHVLDSMNEIEVRPGQVIFNGTPARLRQNGICSAEVHALGNPLEKEMLLLEIRKPGTTYRAWDNARFPLREIGIESAMQSVNLTATTATDFCVGFLADSAPHGATALAACADFVIEHLRIPAGRKLVFETRGGPVSLQCLAGVAECTAVSGEALGQLQRGSSAMAPAALGEMTISATAADVDIIATRIL
ncbi:MAG: hypothetical protein H6978_02805 [Gammaproteobacteria bacterium]|nr:hypothetical protein [Gammaproteobacteria bacterium]